METPWGVCHTAVPLAAGVYVTSTASHGGLRLDVAVAREHLTPEALKQAFPRYEGGSFCWFEEDSACTVVFYEWPEIWRAFCRHQVRQWKKYASKDCRNWPSGSATLHREAPQHLAEWSQKAGESDDQIRARFTQPIKDWMPEYWEQHHQVVLQEGESYIKDQIILAERHRTDWIAVSAFGDWHEGVPKGMVGVVCCTGGRAFYPPSGPVQEKWFLVPADEYTSSTSPIGFVVDPLRHQEISALE